MLTRRSHKVKPLAVPGSENDEVQSFNSRAVVDVGTPIQLTNGGGGKGQGRSSNRLSSNRLSLKGGGFLEKETTLKTKILERKTYFEQLLGDMQRWMRKSKRNDPDAEAPSLLKYHSVFHFVVCKTVESHAFNFCIIMTIVINMITIALETVKSYQNKRSEQTFLVLSKIYLSIYTVEFFFKIYADRMNYWNNNYNRMDFFVLSMSYVTDVILAGDTGDVNVSFLKIFRALRALRALRSISFIRPLQVLVSALLKTMSSIVYLVALLALLMFVYAMIGHYAFGRGPDADPQEWGTVGISIYQLWILVTLDSWTDIQDRLLEREFKLGHISLYIIPWIFVCNFIFTNLFIGVVVQNLEEAQNEEKQLRDAKRAELFNKRKNFILEKQRRDLDRLMKSQEKHGKLSLDDFLKTLAGTLNHEDVAPIKTLCCSRLWFETYMESCLYYEHGRKRVHRLHFLTATKLHELFERRMEDMQQLSIGYDRRRKYV